MGRYFNNRLLVLFQDGFFFLKLVGYLGVYREILSFDFFIYYMKNQILLGRDVFNQRDIIQLDYIQCCENNMQ